MKLEWYQENQLVQAERTAYAIAWTVRSKTVEEVHQIWKKCEKIFGAMPGYRNGGPNRKEVTPKDYRHLDNDDE